MPFMQYSPHSGWGNQMYALACAACMARALNRSLVLPMALKHHDSSGGSCSLSSEHMKNHLFNTSHLLEREAMVAGKRPGMESVLDVDSLGVTTVHPSAVQSLESRVLETECLHSQQILERMEEWGQADVPLLRFGGLYSYRVAVRDCMRELPCPRYSSVYRGAINAAMFAAGLHDNYTAAHIRLKDNRSHYQQPIKGHGTLYVATDSPDLIAPFLTQWHGPVLTYSSLQVASVGPEWLLPIITDVIVATRSVTFLGNSKSTLSTHIKGLRQCNDAFCYARRYPELRKQLCRAVLPADPDHSLWRACLSNLRDHWDTRGKEEGRIFACDDR
mmetsp:Transcript_51989/g.111146  ORF Transcript_51989/g.111146 Transcript_51989/m.111146 type:complete len:331 (-) Transcript_51989:278-1270(-)